MKHNISFIPVSCFLSLLSSCVWPRHIFFFQYDDGQSNDGHVIIDMYQQEEEKTEKR